MTVYLGAACAQLTQELQQVMARAYAIAPSLRDDRNRTDVTNQVRMFGDDIAVPDSPEAQVAANRAYTVCWGYQEAPLEWWDTPLAQTIAHILGYPWKTVPYTAAARILGVSRQRIYQMHKGGILVHTLDEHGVTADSLRDHIQSRA